ncbi:unnamed protein product, partial [Phaeothamnion confervicola]
EQYVLNAVLTGGSKAPGERSHATFFAVRTVRTGGVAGCRSPGLLNTGNPCRMEPLRAP